MDKSDRMRACYQHACLRCVCREQMTNESLRQRFTIDDKNYSMASRIITDTINENLIKPYDPENKSKKHAKYVTENKKLGIYRIKQRMAESIIE